MVENHGYRSFEAEVKSKAEQNDPEIRLWRLESQKRVHASKVLIIGLSDLSAEIAKYLILSGVRDVSLLDDKNDKDIDFYSAFMMRPNNIYGDRVSLARAHSWNRMARITFESKEVEFLPYGYFTKFDIVCATGLKQKQLELVNGRCRSDNKKFVCGDVWGMFGYMFADLIDHEYSEEIVQHKAPDDAKNARATVSKFVKRRATYVYLENALSIDWTKPEHQSRLHEVDPAYFVMKILFRFKDVFNRKPLVAKMKQDIEALSQMRDELVKEFNLPAGFIRDVLLTAGLGQFAEAATEVGEVIGHEVVKAISQRDPPLNNMYFFSPVKHMGYDELYAHYDDI